MANIFSLWGYTVSGTTTQLCWCSEKALIQAKSKQMGTTVFQQSLQAGKKKPKTHELGSL